MMGRFPTGAAMALLFLGCSGGESTDLVSTTGADAASGAVPVGLVESSWQVRLSDDALRAPFEADQAWGQVFNQDLAGALASFSAEAGEGRARARMHLAEAALYRQAALMGAYATVEVYESDAQGTDPVEVAHLVGVSKGLLGDCEGAAKTLAAHEPAGGAAYGDAHAAWRAWAEAGCAWPPEPASLKAGLPEAAPGTAPELTGIPHYRFVERSEDARSVEASDPSVLLALSLWHEAAARASAPEGDGLLMGQLMSPWLLPGEADPDFDVQPMDDAWLFAGFYLGPADVAFVAQARRDGVAAIDAWKDRSAQAAALAPAVVDGRLDPEKALDQAAALDAQLDAAMAARSGGEQGFHAPFSDLARVGTLRAAMVVAAGAGQERDSGVLRLNVVDQAAGPTADPVFYMATSAWDAGNRNPLRAQEAVHRLVRTYPSVAAARAALDALHIRLSRTAAPATAAH